MDNQYPDAVERLIEALGLTKDTNGLARLREILQLDRANKITITEGQWEGAHDRERIDREILPDIIKEYPEFGKFLDREDMKQNRVDLTRLATWIPNFTERLHLLSGDRPLPSHHAVPVKNIRHIGSDRPDGPEFGFLVWLNPGCKVVVDRDSTKEKNHKAYEIYYETIWQAFMSGWNVD